MAYIIFFIVIPILIFCLTKFEFSGSSLYETINPWLVAGIWGGAVAIYQTLFEFPDPWFAGLIYGAIIFVLVGIFLILLGNVEDTIFTSLIIWSIAFIVIQLLPDMAMKALHFDCCSWHEI